MATSDVKYINTEAPNKEKDFSLRKNAAETMQIVINGSSNYHGPSGSNPNIDNDLINSLKSKEKKLSEYQKEKKEIVQEMEEINKHSSENNQRSDDNKEYLSLVDKKINDLKSSIDDIQEKLSSDKNAQLDPNNLVSSITKHRIHDGQKRYKTLGETTSSNYPRPKTLFRVFFEPNEEIRKMLYTDKDNYADMCDELSKFVLSVDKPSITYTTKQMNQYNRIKYVYDNIKYGTLKITFIDVKDNPIQKAFFNYMEYNNNDIKNGYTVVKGNSDGEQLYKINESDYMFYYENNKTGFEDTDWGLNINSSKHMFNSITICEYFLNKIMVYKIENPTLKDINFGTNKIGDYNYNEIIVQFDVEGITNLYEGYASVAIGASISEFGGEALAHKLGMRWYKGNDDKVKKLTSGTPINEPDPNYINKLKTDERILNAQNKEQLKQVGQAITDYINYPNKTKYIWIDGDTDYGRAIGMNDIGKLFAPRYKQLTDLFKF